MNIFRKILKNKLFYLVLLLGVFLTPIVKFTLRAQEVYDNGFNLANPDLKNKEYLGDGVYRLSNVNGITVDYNVFNGEYEVNGTTTGSDAYAIIGYTFEQDDYVLTFYGITGSRTNGYAQISLYSGTGNPTDNPLIDMPETSSGLITETSNYTVYGDMRRLNFYTQSNITFNNYRFKLQLEKGTTATPYKLPIQALYDHAYSDGFSDGFYGDHGSGYVEVDSTLEFNVIDFTTNELDVDPAIVYNFFRNGFSFNDSVTFLLNDDEYNVTSYTINHLREYTMEFNVDGETYKITSTPTTLNIYSYIKVDGDDVDNLENMRFVWTYPDNNSPDIKAITFDDIVFVSNNDTYYGLYARHSFFNDTYVVRYYNEDNSYLEVSTWMGVDDSYRTIDFIGGNLNNSGLIDTLKEHGTFYDMGKGFDNGDNIKITLGSLIPQSYFEFIDQGQYDAKYNDGYNQAREDYGYYDEESEKWVKVDERQQVFYDRGYQDGVDDTNTFYNDNGLFIPKTTPKGHLVVDFDLRYGEPYFYLQDFNNVDDVYFGYQHNRWLEKAFEWAYDNESDFLAINDLYAIKYQSDEVLYKYFFYKYDTDSIYFYNDNGTLLKIVERVDFDYYVYEVPELTQEEQARIDNAYNKGMRDYGYYDSESEEYLTATEYGDIQYNLGVQSTRDKAYSDGFVVAMWYSHQHGFDWVRATYYELIAERPILHNASDITSFAYQEGYDVGFDVGDGVGYIRGYDWGYEDGSDDGYKDGYDDGEFDGYEDGYNKGYEVAVNNTYDAIYDDIYDIGYKDGQKTGMNNKFYTGLEKWIVPAIIVVLFFGLLMLFPKNKED